MIPRSTGHRTQEAGPHHRLADDEALGPRDARERAELRVAALDQLAELRRVQSSGHRVGAPELRRVARQRGPLRFIVRRDVHDERRLRAVVDEIVANPFRPPRLARRRVSPEAAVEHRLGQQVARRHVIGMAIGPVRHRDRARAMLPDERDRVVHLSRVPADLAIGPAQVLAPGRAEHGTRGVRFSEALFRCAVAAHLAERQIAQADPLQAVTRRDAQRWCRRGRFRDRRDAGRTRADPPWHQRLNPKTSSEGSSFSK